MADYCKTVTVNVVNPTGCSDTNPCPTGQTCVDGSCVDNTTSGTGINFGVIVPVIALGLIGGFVLFSSGDSTPLPKATYPDGIPPGLDK